MELKFEKDLTLKEAYKLLIVPYGIEIYYKNIKDIDYQILLIVPYGIEIYVAFFLCVLLPHSFNRTLWN